MPINFKDQRYFNDMLIRMMNLRRCMAQLDSMQVELGEQQLDTARASLAEEYHHTLKLVKSLADH